MGRTLVAWCACCPPRIINREAGPSLWLSPHAGLRGALLLGDYLLHAAGRLAGCTVLELGAGPGVAGLLAAQHARRVFLTGGQLWGALEQGYGILHLVLTGSCEN